MPKKLMSAFAKTNRVPTVDGWKYVGELTSKDHVFGIDGAPVRVRNVMYCNALAMHVQLADGRRYVCSEYTRLPGGMAMHEAMRYLQVYRSKGTTPAHKAFHGPAPGPAAYTHRDVPLEPYLIGLLCSEKTIVKKDSLVVPRTVRESAKQLSIGHDIKDKNLVIPFERNANTITRLERLYHGGLEFLTKYIASDYMLNDIGSRQDLLAGIVDSVGRPLSGCCKLLGLGASIRMDVCALANSLGMVAIETGPDEVKIFSDKIPSHRAHYQEQIDKIKPPANAGHPIIRKIECRGFTRSAQIEVYGDTPGILLEDYIPVLI